MPVLETQLREELDRLKPSDRASLLAHIRARVQAGEMEIIPDPGAEVRSDLDQPGFSELYKSPPPPEPSGSLGGEAGTGSVFRRTEMGETGPGAPGGTAPRAGAMAAPVASVATVPAVTSLGGLAMLGGGIVADKATDVVLGKMGVPPLAADLAGDVVGAYSALRNPRSVLRTLKKGAGLAQLIYGFLRNKAPKELTEEVIEAAVEKAVQKKLAAEALKQAEKGAISEAVIVPGAAAGRAASPVVAGLKKSLTENERSIVMRLQGLAKVKANRDTIKEVTKDTFGDEWKEVWKFIMAPHTRL